MAGDDAVAFAAGNLLASLMGGPAGVRGILLKPGKERTGDEATAASAEVALVARDEVTRDATAMGVDAVDKEGGGELLDLKRENGDSSVALICRVGEEIGAEEAGLLLSSSIPNMLVTLEKKPDFSLAEASGFFSLAGDTTSTSLSKNPLSFCVAADVWDFLPNPNSSKPNISANEEPPDDEEVDDLPVNEEGNEEGGGGNLDTISGSDDGVGGVVTAGEVGVEALTVTVERGGDGTTAPVADDTRLSICAA